MHGKLPRSYETLADIFFHKEFIFSSFISVYFFFRQIKSQISSTQFVIE